MRLDRETTLFGNFFLPPFDFLIMKFFDMAAIGTNQVVMMLDSLFFKNGFSGFEMVPFEETSLFELCQGAIDSRQTNVHVFTEQQAIDIVCRQVFALGLVEQLQNLHARESGLEPDAF